MAENTAVKGLGQWRLPYPPRIPGKVMDVFARNAERIGKLVQQYQLQRAAVPTELGIAGGIRVPHLHVEDETYILTDKQWSEFSKSIVADAKLKLAKVNEVSFEEGIVLGSLL